MQLLSRKEFKEEVFKRDNYQCVVCKAPAVDAHHILDRSLFGDGGYYLANGVSLCNTHHLEAEKTLISCETLRALAKITSIVLPEHLEADSCYDKWGNPILINELRLRGELFFEAQDILQEVLHLFTPYIKFPRTFHFPWSEGIANDDKILSSIDTFVGKRVIVTVKLDGENFSVYNNGYVHARSVDSKDHPSRHWVKNYLSSVSYQLPKGWHITGENLYAKHTIHYNNLNNYFYVISIWDDKNKCLSWDETVVFAKLLELETIPVIYDGVFNEKIIKELYTPIYNKDPMEGYVVRIADEFDYKHYRKFVGKFVNFKFRQEVNASTHHWSAKSVIKNNLKKETI